MIYQDNRTARKYISRRQAELTTTMVNQPVDESEFTLAKIGLRLGERIRDRRTGFEYVYGEKGATDADMPPGKTLVGRSLPELEALALKPDTGQRQDKTMLIFFWDKEQRSSRHCIQELAKRKEDLKSKGIVIVGVHASNVDKIVLKNWLSEHKITFPVGIITDDVEESLFKWGVKGLPWMILTDRDHTVRAEGFSVSELEEKLAAIKVK